MEQRIVRRMPEGWSVIKGALTAPPGYVWIHNGKSLFEGEYKSALIKLENLDVKQEINY